MSGCDNYVMEFSNYLDGEISLSLRKEIDDHLSICSECFETFRQMQLIQQSLQQLSQITTSPDFERRLHQQLYRSGHQKSAFFQPSWQNWRLPAMGTVLVIATVIFFSVFNSPTDSKRPATYELRGNFYPAAAQLPTSSQANQLTEPPPPTQKAGIQTTVRDSVKEETPRINRDDYQLTGGK
jgi:anti-sigma factor RsiW